MSSIEGIGDEVTNFVIFVVSFLVLYFAWRSTNVREDRLPRRSLIYLDGNRRLQQQTGHVHSVSIGGM